MYPVIADAATVAGDPMYTLELGSPMRPLKLRVVAVMHTSSGPITPMCPPPHAPHVGGAIIAPASASFSSAPLFSAWRYTSCDAGVTMKRTPSRTRLPATTDA